MFRSSVSCLATVKRSKAELGAMKYYWNICKDGCAHMYHGFRLFGVNTKVALQLARRMRKGVALTRRERLLLETATVDLLRLIPFSFFVIVPGAELLLPVALKMFPTLIPSTFETEHQGRNRAFAKAMAHARAKTRLLEFATTNTISRVSVLSMGPRMQEYIDLFGRAHRGDDVPASMIKNIAPLFSDDGPLGMDKLPSDIVVSLAKVSGVHRTYMAMCPNAILAGLVKGRMIKKWEKLQADDRLLEKEGFSDLTRTELELACQMRGMRWVDNTEALEEQLQGWIDLSQDPKVEYHTLFFFKPTANSLSDSIKTCPVEARQKLLGTQHFPSEVKGSMDRLFDNIDSRDVEELDKEETTICLARRVAKISEDALKSATTVDDIEVRYAIAQYLGEPGNAEVILDRIVNKQKTKPTLATVIDTLAAEIHQSAHLVSNVFDTFEMGSGSKAITLESLKAVAARCCEDCEQAAAAAAAAKKEAEEKAKADEQKKSKKKKQS